MGIYMRMLEVVAGGVRGSRETLRGGLIGSVMMMMMMMTTTMTGHLK
jgi:hypothetical protein